MVAKMFQKWNTKKVANTCSKAPGALSMCPILSMAQNTLPNIAYHDAYCIMDYQTKSSKCRSVSMICEKKTFENAWGSRFACHPWFELRGYASDDLFCTTLLWFAFQTGIMFDSLHSAYFQQIKSYKRQSVWYVYVSVFGDFDYFGFLFIHLVSK